MDVDFVNNIVLSIMNETSISMKVEKSLFLSEVLKEYGYHGVNGEAKDLKELHEDHDFRRSLGYREIVQNASEGATYFIEGYKPAHIFEKVYTRGFEEKVIRSMRLVRRIMAYTVKITGNKDEVFLT